MGRYVACESTKTGGYVLSTNYLHTHNAHTFGVWKNSADLSALEVLIRSYSESKGVLEGEPC